jgi:hypothetical protein
LELLTAIGTAPLVAAATLSERTFDEIVYSGKTRVANPEGIIAAGVNPGGTLEAVVSVTIVVEMLIAAGSGLFPLPGDLKTEDVVG